MEIVSIILWYTPKTPGLHSVLLSHRCPSLLIICMYVSFALVTLLANSTHVFHIIQNDLDILVTKKLLFVLHFDIHLSDFIYSISLLLMPCPPTQHLVSVEAVFAFRLG
jgi:hypothetical protein